MLRGQVGQGSQVGGRQRAAAAAVVRVFDGDQAGAGEVQVVPPDAGAYGSEIQRAVRLIGHRARVDAAHRGAAALFVEEDVGLIPQDDLVPAAAVGQQADQVGHGPAGHEQGRFLAGHFRRQGLQAAHGRVFAENIVAQFGLRHGPPHGFGGLGDRVRAQVDRVHSGAFLARRPKSGVR